MQIRKSRRAAADNALPAKQAAEKNLAWAAGAEQYRHRDPLYHVTESFQQTFERIGRARAQAYVGGFTPEERPAGEKEQGERERKQRREPEKAGRASGGQQMWAGNAPAMLTRFSDTAFQRGAMSASVLNGTGKMMLVSCLKRTAKENGPKRLQHQNLVNTGSQMRNVPGRSPDKMVFNRGFAKSAIGLVVDTLRDARQVVDSLADMAMGTGEMDSGEADTLRAMYPFLDCSRDLALEAEYREKLAACSDPREKPILQNALMQTVSLKAKKAQMKNEFINKLRLISDRATETLADLEAPDTLDEIVSSVWQEEAADVLTDIVASNIGAGEAAVPPDPVKGAEKGSVEKPGGSAPVGQENGGGAEVPAGGRTGPAETKP